MGLWAAPVDRIGCDLDPVRAVEDLATTGTIVGVGAEDEGRFRIFTVADGVILVGGGSVAEGVPRKEDDDDGTEGACLTDGA